MARTVPTTPNRRPALPRHGNAASGAAATSATRGGAVDVILMRIRLIPSAAPISLPFFPIGRATPNSLATSRLDPLPARRRSPSRFFQLGVATHNSLATSGLDPLPARRRSPSRFFQLCVATHNSLATSGLDPLPARRRSPSRFFQLGVPRPIHSRPRAWTRSQRGADLPPVFPIVRGHAQFTRDLEIAPPPG